MSGSVPRPPALRLVFWETTERCNLTCRHCRRVTAAGPCGADEFETSKAADFVAQVAECGRPVLVLSGGEALLRPDIFDLAAQGGAAGLPVSLASNGTLIDDKTAERIVGSGIRRTAISLDGPNAETHDVLRALPGSFEAALAGVRCLRRRNASVQINCTLTARNLAFWPDMLDLAVAEQAAALHFFVLVPVGCGAEIPPDARLSAEETETFLTQLFEKARTAPLHLKATCAPQYFRIQRQKCATTPGRTPRRKTAGDVHPVTVHTPSPLMGEGRGGGESVRCNPTFTPTLTLPHRGGGNSNNIVNGDVHPDNADRTALEAVTRGCLAGTGVCFVSHKGDVFPCGYMPLKAGNVGEKRLREIWAQAPLFANLRNTSLLKGRCGRCGYAQICSGCRARALAVSGDAFDEDPGCGYVPPALRRSGMEQDA